MASSRRGPDQCWSWVISMSGFTINMLLSGISRAAGIFYFALINDYGASRREANLPFTIRNVVRNMAGPMVGVIGQRHGVQKVTIIGGICATLGISLCCLAPSVLWITVLWGGLHGLGVALANTLFQITINQYFEKYRATAAGLALSGACIGSFVLPIMLEAILSEYGLAGTFLLTGGLAMQVLPPSVILKEPPWLKNQQQPKNKKPKVVIDLVKMTSSADSIQTLRASKRSWSDTYLRTEEDQSKALWEKQDFSSDSQLFQEVKTTSAGNSDISVLKIEVPDTIIPGHFRDGVGSYDEMFFIIGGVCITTGLLWLLEPWVVKLMKLEKKSVFK